jgi:Uma2 family endonuclease
MSTILEEAVKGRATIVPWTVERYHRAISSGLLPEDFSLELIDGFVVRKDRATAGEDPMTIGDRHRIAVLRLARYAPQFEPLGGFLQTQQPVSLPPLNEPEPDGAVIRGGIDDYLEHPPGAGDVLSVIEVSDSSLSLDLGPKLAAYATAGIPQYIVVDLVSDRVLIHEKPIARTFTATRALGRGETVEIAASVSSVSIAVDRLLP